MSSFSVCRLSAFVLLAAVSCRHTERSSPESIVRQVADYYRSVESLQVEIRQQAGLWPLAEPRTNGPQQFAVQRPNRVSIRGKDGRGIDFVSDGQQMLVVAKGPRKYAQSTAVPSLDGLTEDPVVPALLGTANMFVISLMSADPYADMMSGVTNVTYLRRDTIDGKPAHVLRFAEKGFNWDMWVAAERDPVVLRVVYGSADSGPVGTSVTFQRWEINATLASDAFAFPSREGMQELADFSDVFAAYVPLPPAKKSRLVGQPAPLFSSKLATGESIELADEIRRRRVVMLDFWATWCGPCLQEMPVVSRIARDYGDRGVSLLAVNLRESAETIAPFLAKSKLDVRAVLDEQGAIADQYDVEPIPMLVLIDQKGTIRHVHLGYHPLLQSTLKKEIDALLKEGG